MIYVIGIGLAGKESLSESSVNLIDRAGLLAGGKRHLALFRNFKGPVVAIGADLKGVAGRIKRYQRGGKRAPVVVLATGDPSLYGIADFLIKTFGKRAVRVAPNVSVAQEAFARVRENWNGAKVLSVHGRGGRGLGAVVEELRALDRAALFTDGRNTPAVVAKALLAAGVTGHTLYVCEALGTAADERVRKMTLAEASKGKFHPLNVMVFVRDKGGVRKRALIGIEDKEFARTGELITKQEVRAVTLAKLRLFEGATLWDVGAGTGSVGIEAARLMPEGRVVAFERNRTRVENIKKNVRKFGAVNLDIVKGEAPACLMKKTLPAPDRVFIGGGGAAVGSILDGLVKKIKKNGVVVVNAVTVGTLTTTVEFFKKKRWDFEVTEVSVARSRKVAAHHIMSAYNPVFIISGVKR